MAKWRISPYGFYDEDRVNALMELMAANIEAAMANNLAFDPITGAVLPRRPPSAKPNWVLERTLWREMPGPEWKEVLRRRRAKAKEVEDWERSNYWSGGGWSSWERRGRR